MLQIVKEIQNKLPEIIYFDQANFLRERTKDISCIRHYIEQLEPSCRVVDDASYQVISMLGYLYRILGFEDEQQLLKAEKYFIECLHFARTQQDRGKEVTTLIRLGEVYKYQDRHNEAMALFEEAKQKGQGFQLDFVYQHMAKCLMEMQRYNEAEECLLLALQLRIKKQNQKLIDSTKEAIELNSKLKSN